MIYCTMHEYAPEMVDEGEGIWYCPKCDNSVRVELVVQKPCKICEIFHPKTRMQESFPDYPSHEYEAEK